MTLTDLAWLLAAFMLAVPAAVLWWLWWNWRERR